MRLLLIIALVCTPAMYGQTHGRTLEGCTAPDAIAKALSRLHYEDWRDISLERLRSLWPTELQGKDCDPGGCHDVWSEDRIISGHCECCSTFMFKMEGDVSMPRSSWLENIVLNYTASNRNDLVAVANKFVSALGLAQTYTKSVGKDLVQNFHWETNGPRGRELSAIELRFTKHGDLWELNLNSSQNIVE